MLCVLASWRVIFVAVGASGLLIAAAVSLLLLPAPVAVARLALFLMAVLAGVIVAFSTAVTVGGRHVMFVTIGVFSLLVAATALLLILLGFPSSFVEACRRVGQVFGRFVAVSAYNLLMAAGMLLRLLPRA